MNVSIIGTGISRFGMFLDSRLRDLASEAADQAMEDADVQAEDIGLVVFGNAGAGILTGQEMIRAHTSLGQSRVAGRPMISVENACASSSSAFHLGTLAVASGMYDTVLVVGAEKMTNVNRSLAGRALATAIDVDLAQDGPPTDGAGPVFMEIYAAEAREFMARTGATTRDFAIVAAKNRRNGSLNPIAQNGTALTAEEVLAGRVIVNPLTRPMCSSIGDGAAAVVLSRSSSGVGNRADCVRVAACAVGAGRADDAGEVVQRTALAAYEQAGVGPEDLDLCEVHDAAAPAELVIAEEIGLVAPGEAVGLVRSGATEIAGRIPINPSGGLIARGHPVGATGTAQIVELSDQLRRRAGQRQVANARIGLAENAGGSMGNGPAACVVTILERP